jgi:hypothetical protein
MAAPLRYSAYSGYLIASDNSYSVPPQPYSSNIKAQMTQAQNVTDWLVSRSSIYYPTDGSNTVTSSSMWFLAPTSPTNVAFNTFNNDLAVSTGLPQQMSPFVDVNTAVWGIYLPAITGQGQQAAAVGKIQLYGTRVTGLAGQGNTPDNATSATAFLALANSIGKKYVETSQNGGVEGNGFGSVVYGTQNEAIIALQTGGAIISLNGAPVYIPS